MPRRAKRYATRAGLASSATSAALVLALAGTVAGCTGSSGGEDDKDGKSGGASASPSAAAPGKYDSLPEPCGTVGVSHLRDMLPGAAAAEDEGGEENTAAPSTGPDPLEGEASATYDTDRSVGCRWKSATTLGTRHLSVQFERVVSYDPSISDNQQAERLYGEKAREAGISGAPGSTSGSPAGETPDGHASPTAGDGGKSTGGGDPDSSADPDKAPAESPSTPEEDVAPRTLQDIGDAAYLDDALHTADSGLHRDITLVFRTGNVIATVEYDQWVTDKHRIPDSHELQKKTRELAEQLAGRFEED
ncbi:hypothetical protein [Streptomyces sp. WMMB303]|uniref:hypothetical protein n=1 Tax=Streptomyces sp. WMMB303 TaxID=3034154 RepID=UPI0023EB553A|nr:hypothetical protein [Streptomyces sp. WMMB303]MDF4254131.1 hypothetical protein [Streptomyces sp. WMMB303]